MDHEILKLYDRTQKLASYLPTIAAKKIETQYSVIKNQHSELRTFQDRLIADCNELKHREKIYLENLHEITQAIQLAHTTLKSQQMTDDNEAYNIQQLQDLLALLQSKRDLIDRLNSSEFILYFKRAKHLHEVMIEYSHSIESIKNRIKQLEINQYNKFNFDKRCQKWNEYIQAVEQHLSTIHQNLYTNYHGLLEIDTDISNAINDFHQREQELIQLMNEGKQLIEQNLLNDQNTFTKLEQRWQTIVKTYFNRQTEVKDLIKLWLSYQNHLESYYRLLKSKYELEQEQLQSPTIAMINQIKQGNYINATQNEELRHLLEKIHEINRRLVAHSEPKTQSILEKEWSDLQRSANEIDIDIKQRSDTLVTVGFTQFIRSSHSLDLRSLPIVR